MGCEAWALLSLLLGPANLKVIATWSSLKLITSAISSRRDSFPVFLLHYFTKHQQSISCCRLISEVWFRERGASDIGGKNLTKLQGSSTKISMNEDSFIIREMVIGFDPYR